MKDDYLWDGSGEADPEVEELEMLLGKFSYQPKPLEMPAPPRRIYWPQIAAAAVILMALAAGLLFYLRRESGVENQQLQAQQEEERVVPEVQNPNQQSAPTPKINNKQAGSSKNLIAKSPGKPKAQPVVKEEIIPTGEDFIAAGTRQPIVIPFVDPETSKHIERSQFLLRDFRNASESDVTYERERSKRLLGDNILLRRSAESTGNMPVEDLLGSLEPILLDIANLPEKPTADDVRAIKERIQKREIIATLQVYSAQAVSIVQ
jgi:hypothetical protein